MLKHLMDGYAVHPTPVEIGGKLQEIIFLSPSSCLSLSLSSLLREKKARKNKIQPYHQV